MTRSPERGASIMPKMVFRDIQSLAHSPLRKRLMSNLIAGLPNQRLEIWKQNLDWNRALRPEHVSIYMLELEERSAWAGNLQEVPDDEFSRGFYLRAAERLARTGYAHRDLELGTPGLELRHNLKYWTGLPYRGFGVGAIRFPENAGSGM